MTKEEAIKRDEGRGGNKMAVKEITVNVGVKMTVSDEMVSRCLRLLEMWQNDNPDKTIICDTVKTTEGNRFFYSIREGRTG